MITVDFNPDEKKLKEFGFFSLGGFLVIGLILGLKFRWIQEGEWLIPGILWGVAVISALLALTAPKLLKPSYLLLTAISAVIGPIVATIIMGLIFLLIFFPLGLIFRLRKRDELHLKLSSGIKSYWEARPKAQPPERYFRQY